MEKEQYPAPRLKTLLLGVTVFTLAALVFLVAISHTAWGVGVIQLLATQ